MPKYKVNSIKGVNKRHSILRAIVPLLEGIMENTPINEIGTEKIVRINFKPIEPVEIRGFNTEGKIHNMKIRAYGESAYQDVFLYGNKKGFSEVMQYILKYCEKKDK